MDYGELFLGAGFVANAFEELVEACFIDGRFLASSCENTINSSTRLVRADVFSELEEPCTFGTFAQAGEVRKCAWHLLSTGLEGRYKYNE